MPDVSSVWDDYYADPDRDTAIKDEQFFALEVAALIDALRAAVADVGRAISVLELGSGTGFLARTIVEALSPAHDLSYVGIDISSVGCDHARARKIRGAEFLAADFLEYLEADERRYDAIVTQRSIMAVLDAGEQRRLLAAIRDHLGPTGVALLSEGTQQALDRLSKLRRTLGIPPLAKVWHSLYVDEESLQETFSSVEARDFSSLFWLITRVIYPYFEEPRHNSELHRFAASLPQVGPFGLVKLFVARA